MYVLTFDLDKSRLALPVEYIQEILLEQKYTTVPLSGDEIEGLFSLRGQVITAIDLRKKMNMDSRGDARFANIVIKIGEEQFSFIVDQIGEVVQLDDVVLEPLPGNLRLKWGKWSQHVFREEGKLVLLMDLHALIDQQVIA
ncbi:hypothetical protein EP331_13645 [bacterium]|nr:MAG: hypothetical protein EP331_13645 [bacterium]